MVNAGTDIMAMGAARAVNEAGMKIPDDISIVGFDDYEFAKYLLTLDILNVGEIK